MSTNEHKLYWKIMIDTSARREILNANSDKTRMDIIIRKGEEFNLPVTEQSLQALLFGGSPGELSDDQWRLWSAAQIAQTN